MSACCGRYLIIDFLIGTGKSIKFMLSVVKRRSMQVQVFFFHNFESHHIVCPTKRLTARAHDKSPTKVGATAIRRMQWPGYRTNRVVVMLVL